MPSKKDARILGDAATLAVAILGDAPGALPAAGRDAQILGGGGVAFFTYYASPEAHVVAPRSAPRWRHARDGLRRPFPRCPDADLPLGRPGTSPATFVAAGELRCATVSAANVSSARLTVSNNGVDFGDVGAVARFWPEPSLDAVVPSAGPDSGETGVVLRGAGVGDLAPLATSSADRVACDAPPKTSTLAESDVVAVAISTNGGVDYSHALQFSYFAAHISLDAATPARGPAAGGVSTVISGSGFPLEGGVLCKFGDDIVAGTQLTSSEVACDAPPAPVARDVQRVVVDGRAAVNEIQTIDVVGRKAAQEVQEVRVTAAGGSRREDFVDLSVDLAAGGATAEEQTVTTSLSGHEAEVQRLTLALAPSNREVQTLDVSAFVEAYAYNGSLNCRGYGNPTKPCADEFGGRDYGFSFIFGPYVTEMIWVNASAYEVEAALNDILDDDLIGDVAVTALDRYEGRDYAYKIEFVDACRASVSLLDVEDRRLRPTPTDMGHNYNGENFPVARVVDQAADFDTIRGTLEIIAADDTGGLTISDTTVEDVSASYARGCGYVYDVTFPAGRDFSSLVVHPYGLSGAGAYGAAEETTKGSQYEVHELALYGKSGSYFLTYDGSETTDAYYKITYTDAVEDGQLAARVRVGGVANVFDSSSSSPTYTGTSANLTVLRAGRWSPLSGSFTLGLGGVNVSVPHDATADELAAILSASQPHFGRPTVARSAGDANLETYEWTVTFADVAGVVPEMVAGEGTLTAYGASSVATDTERQASGSACCVEGRARLKVRASDYVEAWTRYVDVGATVDELQEAIDDALNGTSLAASVEARASGAATRAGRIGAVAGGGLGRRRGDPGRADPGVRRRRRRVAGGVVLRRRVAGRVPGIQRVLLTAAAPMAGFFRLEHAGARTEPISVHASDHENLSTGLAGPNGTTYPTPSCVVVETRATSRPSPGFFALSFDGETTASIAANASADDVRDALEALSTVGSVNVTDAPMRIGHVVSERRGAGRVRPGGARGASPYGASEEAVRYALEDGACADVRVNRDAYADASSEGWRYRVTFRLRRQRHERPRGRGGPDGRGRGREGPGDGPRRARGRALRLLYLSFRDATTAELGTDASAADVEAALEALETVGDVEVFKVRESAARTTWTVTFTTLGGPTNLGDLPLLAAEFDNRKVWDARAAPTVDKLAAGCCEVALSFNGGADFSRNADPTAVVFSRDVSAIVTRLHPAFGPARGGTEVTVFVAGSAGLSGYASSMAPPDGALLWCVFGGVETRATYVNDTACTCVAPQHAPAVAAVEVVAHAYAEKSRAVVAAAGFANYDYLAEERVSLVAPALADGRQGSEIFVLGSFAEVDAASRTCDFHLHAPPSVGSRPRERFLATKAYVVNASVVACFAPSLEAFGVGDAATASASVTVTANGVDAALGAATLRYAPPPSATRADPPAGPRAGGTVVRVLTDWNATEKRAADLAGADGLATCDFGGAVVAAAYRSREELECVAPPFEPVRAVHTLTVSSAAVTRGAQVLEVALDSATAADASGAFRVELEGVASAWIDINATAAEVEAILEAMAPVGDVAVALNGTRVVAAGQEGRSWAVHSFAVAFKSREGPVPTFAVDDSRLSTLGAGDAVRAYPVYRGTTGAATAEAQTIEIRQPDAVSEVQRVTLAGSNGRIGREKVRAYIDESSISTSDTFYLTYDGVDTAALDWDATADDVRAALEDVAGVGRVDVARAVAGTRGFGWTIAFLDYTNAAAPAPADDVEDAIYEAWRVRVSSETDERADGRAWRVTFPPSMDDVPALVANDTYVQGFYNVTVDEVVAGVAPLDGFLVLETTDQYGNQNSSAKLPVASLTPAMIQNALEDAMGAYVAGRHVVVSRTDVDAGVFCDNETSSNEKCRGVDFAITFPATMGDVPLVVSNLTGSTPSARMTATTYSIANGTWAPLGGSFNLTVPGGWYPRRGEASVEAVRGVDTRALPWNATARDVRALLDRYARRVRDAEKLDSHAGLFGHAWTIAYADEGERPLLRCDRVYDANVTDRPPWTWDPVYGRTYEDADGAFVEPDEPLSGDAAACGVAETRAGAGPYVDVKFDARAGTVDGGTEVSVRLSTMVPVVLNRTITTEGVRHLPRHATAYDAYDEDGLNYDATDDAYFFAASGAGFYQPGAPRRGPRALSVNGGVDYDEAHGALYHYRLPARVAALEPSWGPAGGGATVRVRGERFPRPSAANNATMQRCRFGDIEAPATWHSPTLVSCPAPPLRPVDEVQSVAVVSAGFVAEIQEIETSARGLVRERHEITMFSTDGAAAEEVQRVEIAYDADVLPEVQDVSIRAHVDDGPAVVEVRATVAASQGVVQRLSVRATTRREVQVLTLAPLLGGAPAADLASSREVQELQLLGFSGDDPGNFTVSDGTTTTRSLPLGVAPGVLERVLANELAVDVDVTVSREIHEDVSSLRRDLRITFAADTGNVAELSAAPTASLGARSARVVTLDDGAVQEVQLVSWSGATGGTFRLSDGSTTTDALDYNATAEDLAAPSAGSRRSARSARPWRSRRRRRTAGP
ncbi:hypothetical protein JL720_13541 [Aureococcus anophagefferens]|nr:hypothetical protein JL720_13541 [Aureococcus anophagefferens]